MDDERLVFIRDAVIAIVALGVIIYAVRVFYGIPNGKLLAREEGVPFVVKLQGYSPSGSFAYNGLVDGAGIRMLIGLAPATLRLRWIWLQCLRVELQGHFSER